MASTVCYVRGVALLVLMAMTMCMSAELPKTSRDTAAPAKHSAGHKLTLKGVANSGEVTPMLYRGAQPSREGFEALAKMGIDIVVDVRLSGRGRESKEVKKLGMQYVSIPWHCLFPRDETFARFLMVLKDNPGKKVFVHCRYGDDRTGMMIAAYRMADEGWTPEEARKEMEQFGFTPYHQTICPALGPYEREFPQHVKKNPVFEGVRGNAGPLPKR